jgi:hypothetical protein
MCNKGERILCNKGKGHRDSGSRGLKEDPTLSMRPKILVTLFSGVSSSSGNLTILPTIL